jgi:hypothetical protein
MIKEIGFKFQGNPHSGLDDARNIAYVAQCLLQDGASLVFNEKLSDENAEKKANSNSSFSTPVSKAEFSIICGTLKPNFPAKKSPVTSKTPDTNTVAKEVLVKACNSETEAKPVVKEVVKIPAIASNSANGDSTKTTAKKKKNQHSTKDTVKIPATKNNQPNMQPDSLVKTSSKANTPSTSEKTSANVTSTQSSVKRPPGKSTTAKISKTSAENTKTADVIKQELMLAKKCFYSKSEHIPFKNMTQLKEHIEDLKKSLKAARSREEKAVLVTNLDLSKKKEFKVPEATSKSTISNDCQLVKGKSSSKEGKKVKKEVNQQLAVINTEKNLPVIVNSNCDLAALDGNGIIGNYAAGTDEKERLFFEDFENLLTMNNSYP